MEDGKHKKIPSQVKKKISVSPASHRRPRNKLRWYVYAIECDNSSVYIGQTRDLVQRWHQHLKGQGARWTRKYKPRQLFYAEECESYLASRKRERELKKSKGRKFLKEILKTNTSPVNKPLKKLLQRIRTGTTNVHNQKGNNRMPVPTSDLFTAGNIAKALSASEAKVKKIIQTLGIKPAAKKGVCNYYSKDILAKVKSALQQD